MPISQAKGHFNKLLLFKKDSLGPTLVTRETLA